MMGELFRPYNRQAYGLFRFVFFISILLFHHYFHFLDFEKWFTPEFQEYYEPISLFRYFTFEEFQILNSLDWRFIWKISLLLCAFGVLFPVTAIINFVSYFFLAGIMLNFGKVHHVNHMPVFIMGIMALSFNPGSYSVDSLLARLFGKRLPTPTAWALKTAQIYMCLVYFASGIQKMRLSGLDWIFSDNMQHILLTRPTLTPLGLWVAQYPLLCKAMAFTAVWAEITAPLALFSRRYRLFVIPTLFMFHIGAFATLGWHGYFLPYNLCFMVWLPWEKMHEKVKTYFMISGIKFFDAFPFLGNTVKWFYTKILFSIVKKTLRIKYGDGFDLVLRHSILKRSFNPFLSDIDYTVIINREFDSTDDLLKTLIHLTHFKIFDYPQVYLREEWEELQSYGLKAHERFNFMWNVRKVGWLAQKNMTDLYEEIKKTRALKISQDYISKDIHHWTVGKENFPTFNPELPQVCPYIPFLEMTSPERSMVYDVNQLMFLISLLPGEENWVELNQDCLDFKRKLWVYEYLLSRSHLRIHSRYSKKFEYYKTWLRDLEKKYQQIFSGEIILQGEEHDMDQK